MSFTYLNVSQTTLVIVTLFRRSWISWIFACGQNILCCVHEFLWFVGIHVDLYVYMVAYNIFVLCIVGYAILNMANSLLLIFLDTWCISSLDQLSTWVLYLDILKNRKCFMNLSSLIEFFVYSCLFTENYSHTNWCLFM